MAYAKKPKAAKKPKLAKCVNPPKLSKEQKIALKERKKHAKRISRKIDTALSIVAVVFCGIAAVIELYERKQMMAGLEFLNMNNKK